MLAPLKWIEEFVPLHLPARKVADLFTSIGLECEGIGVVEGTEVLELDTPSNRTDILSIYGLARELAVRTDQPLSPLSTKRAIYSEVGDGAVEIQLLDDQCQHYLGIPLQLSPSPHTDLSEKLLWMGRNPIHPVVDLANVVLFETGQPLHLFGRAHLEKGLQVGVGRTGCFEGLDGEAYDLSPSDLLVLSGEEVLAIAGLLGGCRSAAQEGEGAFYLEAATFAPHRVRRTGRRLSLSTDSSYRFERGVDPQGYLLGAERFLWWVKKLGWGGQEGEGSFVGNSHDASLTIPWQGKEVESRLGFALPPHEEERIFFGLGLERKR
ncbi:hypothetical protein H8D30_00670, partial [bacterium]|nr:hypothetical protein [bacterium]